MYGVSVSRDVGADYDDDHIDHGHHYDYTDDGDVDVFWDKQCFAVSACT